MAKSGRYDEAFTLLKEYLEFAATQLPYRKPIEKYVSMVKPILESSGKRWGWKVEKGLMSGTVLTGSQTKLTIGLG